MRSNNVNVSTIPVVDEMRKDVHIEIEISLYVVRNCQGSTYQINLIIFIGHFVQTVPFGMGQQRRICVIRK